MLPKWQKMQGEAAPLQNDDTERQNTQDEAAPVQKDDTGRQNTQGGAAVLCKKRAQHTRKTKSSLLLVLV